ncbi:MAG: asparagine synthase (glutamine-hydrolyzing) [Clostridiales bacterium]|nr:asparagine synthase (glutamine-hydrolyzing) [Clostridiales bacterium]
MCAIAGIIGRSEDGAYGPMLETMERRGPDQEGLWVDPGAALLHRRLSVVDLANGRQPMELTWQGDTYILVYNGELYNTEELKRELASLGHEFTSHSDTEVLLHAYVQWKASCVEKLNGIFAFGVYEQRTGRLFLARDRIGVKPLFYTCQEEAFLFSSEIKTLLAYPGTQAVLTPEGVGEILLLGPGRTPGCGVLKGIHEVRPGWSGYYENGELSLTPYWRLTDRIHEDDLPTTLHTVRELVTDAIRRQLVSDVPIGCFLSGGLDSSILAAVAARSLKKRGQVLDTFSVTYRENERYFRASRFQPNSDDEYIGLMTRALGSRHHRIELDTGELADALYDAVDARDLPGMADVDSSLLLFCKKVCQDITVALSGECADEIFGGYPWYRDPGLRAREGFPWAQSTVFRISLLAQAALGEGDPFRFVEERYRRSMADTHILPETDGEERRMREMTQLNFDWFMQTLLDRKDRMGMYSGLEVRVPFCDHRLAEYMYAVPWTMKELGGYEKGLLRQAMADILPEKVRLRKKSPYPKTHNPAYAALVKERLRDLISTPNASLWTIVRRKKAKELLEQEPEQNWYGQLMTGPQTIAYLLQVEYWLRKYRVRIA